MDLWCRVVLALLICFIRSASICADAPTEAPTDAPTDPPIADPTAMPTTLFTIPPTSSQYATVFTFNEAEQQYIVPPNAVALTFTLVGASGSDLRQDLLAGRGSKIVCKMLSVSPGDVLYVYVGGQGGYGRVVGGFNGGGESTYQETGSGGGATDVRTGMNFSTRIAVAGGGGGADGWCGSNGGDAGHPAGADGPVCGTDIAAGGGNQTAGGAGGINDQYGSALPGTLGVGGNGCDGGGAGGGGGYYGGGGACGSGAGGGSSYCESSMINTVFTDDFNYGHGYAIIESELAVPSINPTPVPTAVPTAVPTTPTSQPSAQPSGQPMSVPTAQPSRQPSSQPSMQPTVHPSVKPSAQPSFKSTSFPSSQPSSRPSMQPSVDPTAQPSSQPISMPSSQPSKQPTSIPSAQPFVLPSGQPSSTPTAQPSSQPMDHPSAAPSGQPSSQPSSRPSVQPSERPSAQPSMQPSTQPTMQPFSVPSGQPSIQPSSVPSAQPSIQPTVIPSTQPSMQPSDMPSSQPSSQPSEVPSVQPSTQPSGAPSCSPSTLLSVLPTCRPSGQPSRRPSAQPTSRPSAQPSSQPSSRPSRQPTGQPSTQPTKQPSAHPSSLPTALPGEWAVMSGATAARATQLSVVGGTIWACDSDRSTPTSACVLVDSAMGQVLTQYTFAWDSVAVLSVQPSSGGVFVYGHTTGSGDFAACSASGAQLSCTGKSVTFVDFLASSYVPMANKIVYVGKYGAYASAVVLDLSTSSTQSYKYTVPNVASVVLSQALSPSSYAGCFVAGTAVRSVGTAVSYILSGIIRTTGGALSAMLLQPVSGDILNSADLVTSMALESTGPDSFIAGGLELDDGAGQHAYLLRANALYLSVQFCTRYRTTFGAFPSQRRRALTTSTARGVYTLIKSMTLVDPVLYLLVERVTANVSSLTVLKADMDGEILKQVRISPPNNASLSCTSIAPNGLFLAIACSVQRNSTSPLQALLVSMNHNLAFSSLPTGFTRDYNRTFRAERVPFQRTVLQVTTAVANVQTTAIQFTTADPGPTRRPSGPPTLVPTSQPSSAPSTQPSSSPSAAPSVSAHPTSQPSSATPTTTKKPTVAPTVRVTSAASMAPSRRPSASPSESSTLPPSLPPSEQPSVLPSMLPTVRPTRAPIVSPTCAPSTDPAADAYRSAAPTMMPTSSLMNTEDKHSGSGAKMSVVGSSVGAAAFVCAVVYALYWYLHNEKEKQAVALRRAAYISRQAILLAAAEKERAEFIAQELKISRKMKQKKGNKVQQDQSRTGNSTYSAEASPAPLEISEHASDFAYALSSLPPPLPLSRAASGSVIASSVQLSSLHSSELDAGEYVQYDEEDAPHKQSEETLSESTESESESKSESVSESGTGSGESDDSEQSGNE